MFGCANKDAKHQTAVDLRVPAYMHVVGTVIVFQVAIDPLGGAALLVADRVGLLVMGVMPGPFFSFKGILVLRGFSAMSGTWPCALLSSRISLAS